MPRRAGTVFIATSLRWFTSTTSFARESDQSVIMSDKDDISGRIELRDLKILSGRYYTLRLASFDYRRGDGQWQHQERESYDRGDAAAVLPYDRVGDKILLIQQFRWPVFESGYRRLLIEAIAGNLD